MKTIEKMKGKLDKILFDLKELSDELSFYEDATCKTNLIYARKDIIAIKEANESEKEMGFATWVYLKGGHKFLTTDNFIMIKKQFEDYSNRK